MADKVEAKVARTYKGTLMTIDSERGIIAKGKFYPLEAIYDKAKDGDEISVGFNTDISIEDEGIELEDSEEEEE